MNHLKKHRFTLCVLLSFALLIAIADTSKAAELPKQITVMWELESGLTDTAGLGVRPECPTEKQAFEIAYSVVGNWPRVMVFCGRKVIFTRAEFLERVL